MCFTTSNSKGIDHCPDVSIANVTTTDMRHHGDKTPVIFHLGRDPGERYSLGTKTREYKEALISISKVVAGMNTSPNSPLMNVLRCKTLSILDHRADMVPGAPQLEVCDEAVMNWAPAGCKVRRLVGLSGLNI